MQVSPQDGGLTASSTVAQFQSHAQVADKPQSCGYGIVHGVVWVKWDGYNLL